MSALRPRLRRSDGSLPRAVLRPAPGPLPLVVDVSRMDELRGIDWDGRRLRIGAAATYLELQNHEVVLVSMLSSIPVLLAI